MALGYSVKIDYINSIMLVKIQNSNVLIYSVQGQGLVSYIKKQLVWE